MENSNKQLIVFEGGIPPRRVKGDKDYIYPVEIYIPPKFAVTDVLLGVDVPVKGAKVSVGIKDNVDFFLKDIDVSTIGPRDGMPIFDKEGNILSVGYGPGLCHVTTKEEPTYRKAKKTGDPDVKTGVKTTVLSFMKKNCLTAEREKLYMKIPKECSMDNTPNGLRAMIYVVGIQT
jgi:hypothetical protein